MHVVNSPGWTFHLEVIARAIDVLELQSLSPVTSSDQAFARAEAPHAIGEVRESLAALRQLFLDASRPASDEAQRRRA